ncbi:MAG TPA: carboxylating nicotinate-nucleotide diphosphorylase [Thermoanaerobaculia bacterium]|nr:carboxylating nicotinate-nucleotide diphosphorylase [Thermoanaerobaculia bacterium]
MTNSSDSSLSPTQQLEDLVERALAEDLPDITSEAIFAVDERGTARFVAKESGVVAGLRFPPAVFAVLDPESRWLARKRDGDSVVPGDVIAEVSATVRALLSGERSALNFLQRASGIATATRRYVDAVAGTRAEIFDTRKTAPGLRLLDKAAVAAGGGRNHRYALHDMFLVKNNHIDRAGSITAALERIRATGAAQRVMIEVRDLDELSEAIATRPDFILLDNMTPAMMQSAVERVAGAIPLEASGGITLDNIRIIAETGVDRISIGALTHSVRGLDISMRVDSAPHADVT